MIIVIIYLIFQTVLCAFLMVASLFAGTRGIDSQGLFISTIGLILSGIALYFVIHLRRRTVIYLDSSGVETRGGEKYQWSNLCYAKYGGVRNVRLNRIELNFEDGKAVIPALLFPELVNLLKTIPVQKRFR